MYKRKKRMMEKKKCCLRCKIFVSMGKKKDEQTVFIPVPSFQCKFTCTVLILLGFVDILSFYFQAELNGVTLSALLCVHSQQIRQKRRARLLPITRKTVSCSF